MDIPDLDRWRAFAEGRPVVLCSPGYLIYLQGSEATCFYYLKAGQVRSFIQSEDGAERALHVYGPGSLFGEASFFDELPRVSSAVALTSCEIVPIDRELVTEEIEKDPELALAMMKYLARTVRLLSGQLDDMAFRPVPCRLARFLLSGADGMGVVRCTQEEIAFSISASRVTVSRALNQLAREGLVELQYRGVLIRDRPGLERMCAP